MTDTFEATDRIEILDPQHVRTQAAEKKVRLLRQSHLSNGDTCMRRLGYSMDPSVPQSSGPARAIGTAYHAGCEALYQGQTPLDSATVAESTLVGEYGQFPHMAEDTPLDEARAKVLSMFNKYVDVGQWDPKVYEVVGTEVEWFAELVPGWAMKGSIDLVIRDKTTGAIHLDDHKTAGKAWPRGKESPRKHVQPCIYTWAWWQLTGERPVSWSFSVMTYAGVFERRVVQVTDNQIRAALDKAVGFTQIIDAVPLDRLPANPSSFLCSEKWCDFWNICPSGAAAQ